MRDEHETNALMTIQGVKALQQGLRSWQIETIGGFVEEQKLGPPHKRTCHKRTLPLTTG
jgi:hypothetical protein